MDTLLTDLLLRHNCVIIPDLGGFVANRIPAYIDEEKGRVFPPSKQLTFNSRLIKNDGLLVAAWAQKEKISFEEAVESVKRETQSIQQKLRKGQSHTIENIGTLFISEEGRLNFRQDRFFNLLLDSYGLKSVEFIPTDNAIEKEEKPNKHQKAEKITVPSKKEVKTEQQKNLENEKEEASVTPIKTIQPRKKARILKYAAAAAILPIAFYSFWIPLTSDVLQSRVLFKEDFNPFKKSAEAVYQRSEIENLTKELHTEDSELTRLQEKLPENVEVFHYALTEDVYVPVWREEIASTNHEVAESDNTSTVTSNKVNAKYHLIAGCFREIENANGLVEKLNNKGLNAFILDKKDGLHRVTASQVDNKINLEAERNNLSQKGFKTWVLRK
jgi:cell division septation protein DedD